MSEIDEEKENERLKWAIMHLRVTQLENAMVRMLKNQQQRDDIKSAMLALAVKMISALDVSDPEAAKWQLIEQLGFLESETRKSEDPQGDFLPQLVFHLDQGQARWGELFDEIRKSDGKGDVG